MPILKLHRIGTIQLLALLIAASSCNPYPEKKELESALIHGESTKDLWKDFQPLYDDGDINVVIEIPAGTLEKWEVDKTEGKMKLEVRDGQPRIIEYLVYPANYGMIPGTLISEDNGGDGDPLDVIVLGPPIERGNVVKCKLIGILYLTDSGEKDDKLLAVSKDSPFYEVNNLAALDEKFSGVTEILRLWFTNYKGRNILQSSGFGEKKAALEALNTAIEEFNLAYHED